jgi:hypothetical protein
MEGLSRGRVARETSVSSPHVRFRDRGERFSRQGRSPEAADTRGGPLFHASTAANAAFARRATARIRL